MTPATANYGADLVLENGQERIVAQIKRWNQKVGIEAVQQVVAAISHYNADRRIVVTNSLFTSNAEKLARSNNIELWDQLFQAADISAQKTRVDLTVPLARLGGG